MTVFFSASYPPGQLTAHSVQHQMQLRIMAYSVWF